MHRSYEGPLPTDCQTLRLGRKSQLISGNYDAAFAKIATCHLLDATLPPLMCVATKYRRFRKSIFQHAPTWVFGVSKDDLSNTPGPAKFWNIAIQAARRMGQKVSPIDKNWHAHSHNNVHQFSL
jgi:hypothetical protein